MNHTQSWDCFMFQTIEQNRPYTLNKWLCEKIHIMYTWGQSFLSIVLSSLWKIRHGMCRPVATGGRGGAEPPLEKFETPLGCPPWHFIGVGIEVYSPPPGILSVPPGILSAPPLEFCQPPTWLRRWGCGDTNNCTKVQRVFAYTELARVTDGKCGSWT